MEIQRRTVRKITEPKLEPSSTRSHRVRLVLEPGHFEEYDPFLMLAEDWFEPGTFADHPHRGFETVTYVLEGELGHFDNHGGRGSLGPGDVQWMTAGRGVIHNEDPLPGKPVHSLQLWLNLPSDKKMTEPRYQDIRGADAPVRREPGAELKVFSGSSGATRSPTLNHVEVTMVDMRLEPGASITQALPATYNAFIYVLEGSARIGEPDELVRASRVVWLSRSERQGPSEVSIRAESALHALLYAAEPLGEPIAHYGPFVMNTKDELVEAVRDYRAGKF